MIGDGKEGRALKVEVFPLALTFKNTNTEGQINPFSAIGSPSLRFVLSVFFFLSPLFFLSVFAHRTGCSDAEVVVSKKATVGYLKSLVCRKMELDSAHTRVWNYVKNTGTPHAMFFSFISTYHIYIYIYIYI